MKKNNSLPVSPDTSAPWHIIREYDSHCSSEELVRNIIRRHLELSQEKSDCPDIDLSMYTSKEAEPL